MIELEPQEVFEAFRAAGLLESYEWSYENWDSLPPPQKNKISRATHWINIQSGSTPGKFDDL